MDVKTPEHDKLKAALAQARDGVLADFIDFLHSKGIVFAKYPEKCETYEECEANGSEECASGWPLEDHEESWSDEYFHGPPDALYVVGGDTQYSKWIAEFYGVDYDAFQEEKEEIYRAISKAANS